MPSPWLRVVVAEAISIIERISKSRKSERTNQRQKQSNPRPPACLPLTTHADETTRKSSDVKKDEMEEQNLEVKTDTSRSLFNRFDFIQTLLGRENGMLAS
jgi:hypothetical protein